MIRFLVPVFLCAFMLPGLMTAYAQTQAPAPVAAVAALPLPVWIIDASKSTLTFEATQQGAAIEGRFSGFSGDIKFDAGRPAESTAVIRVDIKSVDSKSPDRDGSLVGADWFNIESFPESIYTVSKFEKLNENQYLARGELELRGVKKPLDLPMTIAFSTDDQGRDVAQAVGEISLNRLDFGVGQGEWKDTQAVGNAVKIKVSVHAVRGDPAAQ